MEKAKANIEVYPHKIVCSGNWTFPSINQLSEQITQLTPPSISTLQVDGSAIELMDTAGAWMLAKLAQQLHAHQVSTEIVHLENKQQNLFNLIHTETTDFSKALSPPKRLSFVEKLGKEAVTRWLFFISFLSFIGELSILTIKDFLKPLYLPFKATLSIIEDGGCYALPIIGLLSFLIGIVLAYQMGLQLKNYGANIYIVDLLGISIFREFAPLLTAIIIAGRTGSAFTAEIGTMIVNEEVDALKTMGINPINFLALPKLFGMLIALPLLTVWASLFGIFGGMIMSKNMLHISFTIFIERFREAIALSHYVLGLVKTPVFAIIIVFVGCFQGFQVERRADSVGRQTTKSVVLAIFLIIITDAFFSILFSWAKL